MTANAAAAAAAATSRPAKLEWSQPIWHSLEADPGLADYDMIGAEQLVLTKNSSILSFAEATKCAPGALGCEDNAGHHDIIVKRSDDGGASFGKAVLVHSESNATAQIVIGNAAAVMDESTGRIYIFMCRNNTDVLLSHSDDNGDSWATVKDVTAVLKRPDWGWIATTFSGIQLKRQPASSGRNGRLVVCCDHQDHYDQVNGNTTWSYSHVIISDDAGKTWRIGGNSSRTTNECAIAELANGTIVMNSRNYVGVKGVLPGVGTHAVHRAISWSADGGDSFTPAYFPPSLPESIVEGAMTTDAAGKMLVFTHPANPHNRDHETVYSSIDAGVTWEPALLLDANYSSYSGIIRLPNGSYAVQYNTGSTHMHRCNTPPEVNGSFVGCGAVFAVVTFLWPLQ